MILVVIDTLRADAVRPGDPDSPMPFLSDLATRSVYYELAHSPSSWTLPSMGTLFLAKYPSQADELRAALATTRGLAAGERPETEDFDAEQMEQLRELGYAR